MLEIIGAVLLFRGNSYQGSVWLSSANAVSGKCYDWSSNVTSYFNLREINHQLASKNTMLQHELAMMRRRLEQAAADSTGMRAAVPAGYGMIEARVVENSVSKRDNLMTIDKGADDGVRRDMGVVSSDGVVGIVYLVGEHYSVVIPVLNSHSNISCSIRNKGYFGYLSWTGGDSQYAYMEDVPRYAHYRTGDIIETSGYSSVFPPGITIGNVVCTYNSPDGLSYRIKLKLATDFGRLRDVCVIDNSKAREQLDVLRLAQDSLSSKKQ